MTDEQASADMVRKINAAIQAVEVVDDGTGDCQLVNLRRLLSEALSYAEAFDDQFA